MMEEAHNLGGSRLLHTPAVPSFLKHSLPSPCLLHPRLTRTTRRTLRHASFRSPSQDPTYPDTPCMATLYLNLSFRTTHRTTRHRNPDCQPHYTARGTACSGFQLPVQSICMSRPCRSSEYNPQENQNWHPKKVDQWNLHRHGSNPCPKMCMPEVARTVATVLQEALAADSAAPCRCDCSCHRHRLHPGILGDHSSLFLSRGSTQSLRHTNRSSHLCRCTKPSSPHLHEAAAAEEAAATVAEAPGAADSTKA